MAKWEFKAIVNNSEVQGVVEANTYGAAYVKALCKLPSSCARGYTSDGIYELEKVTEDVGCTPANDPVANPMALEVESKTKKSKIYRILEPETV